MCSCLGFEVLQGLRFFRVLTSFRCLGRELVKVVKNFSFEDSHFRKSGFLLLFRLLRAVVTASHASRPLCPHTLFSDVLVFGLFMECLSVKSWRVLHFGHRTDYPQSHGATRKKSAVITSERLGDKQIRRRKGVTRTETTALDKCRCASTRAREVSRTLVCLIGFGVKRTADGQNPALSSNRDGNLSPFTGIRDPDVASNCNASVRQDKKRTSTRHTIHRNTDLSHPSYTATSPRHLLTPCLCFAGGWSPWPVCWL